MCRTLISKIPSLIVFFCFSQSFVVFAQPRPALENMISRCWVYPTTTIARGLAADNERVYLGAGEANVESLSGEGKKMWSSELGGEISSNMVPTDAGLLLTTTSPGTETDKSNSILRSLSRETGITNWSVKLPDARRFFLGINVNLAIVVSGNGSVQAVETKTGSVKWKREIADEFVAEPYFSRERVIIAARSNQIFSISLSSGEILSMRKSTYPVTALGAFSTGEIVAGDERGNVSTLNGTDKPLWKFKSGGEISRVFVSGENILATSHDNFVYFLSGRTGDVEWKKRLAGRVVQIGNIGDRYSLIMSFDDNTAFLVDLATGRTAGQIVFADGEKLVAPPVVSGSFIYLLTDNASYAYSLSGCGEK